METKKTAVQWLWMWIMQNPLGSFDDGVKAYNKAKAMEKEQIIDAHFEGWGDAYDYLRDEKPDARQAQDYYEETYGK